MRILLLGGTGAMGAPLAKVLASRGHDVHITSRSHRMGLSNITYIEGNAMLPHFLQPLLATTHWDAIVDFMNRGVENLRSLLPSLLAATSHYVFVSSARVYAPSDAPLTELSPRLLDVCTDRHYLSTNEYALAKAREEDLLRATANHNYTIIRPSITYNDYRLQLGAYEKEGWLYRALHGRSIVFSHDMSCLLTAMTHGSDVARAIAALIETTPAAEVFNITSPYAITWEVVLQCYLVPLRQYLGRDVSVSYTPTTTCWGLKEQHYRLKYSRLISRSFDCSKMARIIDPSQFVVPQKGLASCVNAFLQHPSFLGINWQLEGLNDRAISENTPLAEIPTAKGKIQYFATRHNLRLLSYAFATTLKLSHKLNY